MKLSVKDFFNKCDQIHVDLVKFTKEILNEKLHFLCKDEESEVAMFVNEKNCKERVIFRYLLMYLT